MHYIILLLLYKSISKLKLPYMIILMPYPSQWDDFREGNPEKVVRFREDPTPQHYDVQE